MTRASLLASGALFATLVFVPSSGMAQWPYHDRNNEPACSQIGTVDPRCFVAQLDESLNMNQKVDESSKNTQKSDDADQNDDE
jgi:hypothetical protein